ncbi:MAG TPA: serpin family protein [Kofleriaceae bacterium]|nr:serpin family protein [Kofleriaceae bacterium]
MRRALALTALLLAPAGCSDSSADIPEIKSDLAREKNPDVAPAELAELVAGNAALAADVYRAAGQGGGNLFLSPHSISSALAMTYAGAANATATQMAAALHFTLPEAKLHAGFNALDLALASRAEGASSDTIPFRLTTASSIWGQTGWEFEPRFLDTLAVNYGAGLRVRDFEADPEAARADINGWVEERTNDRIKELLAKGVITRDTRLVLTNAIYFSAAWSDPFEASETADRPFFVGGAQVMVPSLHQRTEYSYAEGAGYRVAELPYDGGQLSMVIVEPDDLAAFEAGLTGPRLAALADEVSGYELDLTLPKFKFDAPLELKPILKSLGMVDAFSEAADFSRIDGTRGLVITDVVHKGFIGIDERGTEAAAATAVIVGDTSVPPSATFVVDRPFLFFIRDRPTGAILFVGRVMDPR